MTASPASAAFDARPMASTGRLSRVSAYARMIPPA